MSVLIFLIILYVLVGASLMKVFEKAGVPGWKALVPGVAAMEWCKIIGRKPAYAGWLLFPIVNIFIYAGMCVDMVRSFGKHGFWDAALSVIYAPISFFMIGRDPNTKYEGPILDAERAFHKEYADAHERNDKLALKKLEASNPFKKSQLREWTEAIIFAVFAAAFIRMFLIEAYVIPTSSMEGTLKVGDFLFVSKAHYGIRTPMTVIQFPLIHNRFSQSSHGLLARESYLRNPSLPYFRLPAIETIDRNDPVVFNFPAGDSVIILPNRTYDVYQWRRLNLERQFGKLPVVARPIDKKDHYIKRCIAIPGDSMQIIARQVFINGKATPNPTHMQFMCQVTKGDQKTNGTPPVNPKKVEELGVNIYDLDGSAPPGSAAKAGFYNLDPKQIEKVRAFGPDIKVEIYAQGPRPGELFPYDAAHSAWSVDDFGPIWIPKAGATTPLTKDNIALYERIIRVYEGNTLDIRDGKFFINGQETTTYTFKQDYYWCMGDNRHNSEDCRVWGYVPADHIVGKPLFIWFSTKNGNIRNGINWDRIFKSASEL